MIVRIKFRGSETVRVVVARSSKARIDRREREREIEIEREREIGRFAMIDRFAEYSFHGRSVRRVGFVAKRRRGTGCGQQRGQQREGKGRARRGARKGETKKQKADLRVKRFYSRTSLFTGK